MCGYTTGALSQRWRGRGHRDPGGDTATLPRAGGSAQRSIPPAAPLPGKRRARSAGGPGSAGLSPGAHGPARGADGSPAWLAPRGRSEGCRRVQGQPRGAAGCGGFRGASLGGGVPAWGRLSPVSPRSQSHERALKHNRSDGERRLLRQPGAPAVPPPSLSLHLSIKFQNKGSTRGHAHRGAFPLSLTGAETKPGWVNTRQ